MSPNRGTFSQFSLPLMTIGVSGFVVGAVMALEPAGHAQPAARTAVQVTRAAAPAAAFGPHVTRAAQAGNAPPVVASLTVPASAPAPATRIGARAPAPVAQDARTSGLELTGGEAHGPSSRSVVLVLLIVLVGGGLALYFKRKNAGQLGPVERPLSVVSTIRLAGKHQLSLVQVPGRVLVVGSTEAGLTLLTELDPAETEPPPGPPLRHAPGEEREPRVSRPAAETAPRAERSVDVRPSLFDRFLIRMTEETPDVISDLRSSSANHYGDDEEEEVEARARVIERLRRLQRETAANGSPA